VLTVTCAQIQGLQQLRCWCQRWSGIPALTSAAFVPARPAAGYQRVGGPSRARGVAQKPSCDLSPNHHYRSGSIALQGVCSAGDVLKPVNAAVGLTQPQLRRLRSWPRLPLPWPLRRLKLLELLDGSAVVTGSSAVLVVELPAPGFSQGEQNHPRQLARARRAWARGMWPCKSRAVVSGLSHHWKR